jgi:RNA polymerase sigma factor (sigma-70 family)
MPDEPLGMIIRRMLRMVSGRQSSGLTDGDLLQRFLQAQDEAAFETLLWRHGAMVLQTCRRLLPRAQDAEDAFQATFLVLCRKARSIRRGDSVGGWLYRVAYRIARSARLRLAGSTTVAQGTEVLPAPEPRSELAAQELRSVLDEELNHLPEKYRTPLVLHYLEGRTVEQTAAELGWAPGTVSGRLARAKDLLHRRLTRRGLTLTTASVAGVLTQEATAAVSPALIHTTVKTALLFGAGVASGQAGRLAKDALRNLFPTRLKIAVGALLMAGAIALGTGAILYHSRAGDRFPEDETVKAEAVPNDEQIGADADGAPLPQGAIRRLGSALFRHGGGIRAMAYSPDGRTLVSAGGLIRSWDAMTGQPQATLRYPPLSATYAVAFSPDARILATDGLIDHATHPFPSKVMLARWPTDVPLQSLEVPGGNVRSIAFSGDGQYVAAGGDFAFVLVWNSATGQVVRRLNVPGGHIQVMVVALSADGKLLAAIDTHTAVRLWDVATGLERPLLAPEGSAATCLAFSKDGRVLACGHGTGSLGLWDPHTGKAIRRISLPADSSSGGIDDIAHLAISSDGRFVATSSDRSKGIVRLWDAAAGQPPVVLQRPAGENERPWTLVFSPDARTLAVGGDLEEIQIWDVATRERIQVTREPLMGPCFAAVSPDGKLVATATKWRRIQLWDARKGTRIGEPMDTSASWVAFSPDSAALAAGWEVRNLVSGERVTFLPPLYLQSSPELFATFSPDQRFLLVSGPGVSMWRIATRQEMWHRGWGIKHPAVFSIDGKTVAWGRPGSSHRYAKRDCHR